MKATLARKRGETEEVANHVVVSIESAGFADVYDMTVPGAESFVANGVIVHNSLGAPHEHMRAGIVSRIARQKAIWYFMTTQGWTRGMVIQMASPWWVAWTSRLMIMHTRGVSTPSRWRDVGHGARDHDRPRARLDRLRVEPLVPRPSQ
jgi:hypothetical protein